MRGTARDFKILRTTLRHCVNETRDFGVPTEDGRGESGKFSLREQDEKQLAESLKVM